MGVNEKTGQLPMMPLSVDSLLTVIVNHNCNPGAIELKRKFSALCDTVLVDSGSELTAAQAPCFDVRLPNIYYNGLLNNACELAKDADRSHVLFITSDVKINDADSLLSRIHEVYARCLLGVYAPSATHSNHRHMHNLGSGGLRKVTFTEGFCFAAPLSYLEKICPIDLTVNKIGHGVDVYLGFLSMVDNRYAMVDDAITVEHPLGSGYSDREARVQRDAWFATKGKKARIFHRMASNDWLKNKLGFYLTNLVMKLT